MLLLVSAVVATGGPSGAAPAAAAPPVTREVGVVDASAPPIRVGAAYDHVTVTVVTGEPVTEMTTDLVGEEGERVGSGYQVLPQRDRPTVFKVWVGVTAADVRSWGAHRLVHRGISYGADGDTVATGTSAAEVRAHSMLGLVAVREGASTQVRGSLRAYHTVEDRYVGWSGRAVSVQRRAGDAWLQVTGATTDARGNFSASVRVPAGSQLRLVAKDAPSIWGAVSGTAAG